MEILHYTEKHNDFRQRLRAFCKNEVIPHADQWEKDHITPREIWRKMGQQGFLCTSISPDYGGMGGDFLYTVIVAEELAATGQTGLAATLHSDIVVPYINSFGSKEIKKKYLPGCVSGDLISAVAMTEPDAGSDVASMTTTAVEEGDEIVITGSKTFISNGVNSNIVVVAAKDPSVENQHESVSLYVIEAGTPGFEKGQQLEKMGWHSQDTSELFFNNCRIPKENRLGEKGHGFLMLMQKLQQERLCCAMGAVAGVEHGLKACIAFLKDNADANGKPFSKQQAVQFAVVEMLTEAKLGRTFIDKLIADHMEGIDVTVETSMAKYWTTEMSNRILGRCLDLFGEYGILEECPITRGWRNARVTPIFAGTNEIMKQIVAKFIGL